MKVLDYNIISLIIIVETYIYGHINYTDDLPFVIFIII